MQGVPLRARRSRCRGWITCALLLLAPWVVRSSLSQAPADDSEAIAVRLSFATEAVGSDADPEADLEPEQDDRGPELSGSSSDSTSLSLETANDPEDDIGPTLPPADTKPAVSEAPPVVKLSFSPVMPRIKLLPPSKNEPESIPQTAASTAPNPITPAVDPERIFYFLKQAKPIPKKQPALVEGRGGAIATPQARGGHAVILAVHTVPEQPPVVSAAIQPAAPTYATTPSWPVLFAPVPLTPPSTEPFASLCFAEGFAEGTTPAVVDASVMPVACSSCGGGGGGVLNPYYSGGYVGMPGGCCGGPGCVPNRKKCYPCLANTKAGRFLCCVYDCICCPDPCYDPHWTAVTDAAFFVDAPRPQTQTRYRYDYGNNLIFPDRNEYFWAQANGFGLGPFPKTPFRGEKRVDYHELSMYTEVATGLIGFFFEMPYRATRPEVDASASGFGDVNFGTKSLLYDCELMQLSFQFKTYMLSGNPTKGLGTGHVTIEPSLILGIRLGPETYSLLEVGEWIPFGNPLYDGAILRANYSFNQVIYRVLPDVPLIGTLELTSWSFQSGNYTDPILGTLSSNGYTYVSVGPGLRLVVCDKLDFGVGTSFAVTKYHWAQQLIRTEFRYRF